MSKYTIEEKFGEKFIYKSISNGKAFVSIVAAKNKLNQKDRRIAELEERVYPCECQIHDCGNTGTCPACELQADYGRLQNDNQKYIDKRIAAEAKLAAVVEGLEIRNVDSITPEAMLVTCQVITLAAKKYDGMEAQLDEAKKLLKMAYERSDIRLNTEFMTRYDYWKAELQAALNGEDDE